MKVSEYTAGASKGRMDRVTKYQRRIVKTLALARAASTEQDRTQLFVIAEAWSKLAIATEKQLKAQPNAAS